MIDQDECDTSMSCSATQVSEDCYAMVDSDTNAVIVPLHPDMCGEIAKCKVPSSLDHGPIMQTLSCQGLKAGRGSSTISCLDLPGVANHCCSMGESCPIAWLFRPGCCVHSEVSKHSEKLHHEEWVALHA